MNRRNFIGSMLAAPAIVRAEILMPVTKIWTPLCQGFGVSIISQYGDWQDAQNYLAMGLSRIAPRTLAEARAWNRERLGIYWGNAK